MGVTLLYAQPSHTTIRSEEHTSELQSQSNLVCRLLLEKKKHSWAPSRLKVLPNPLPQSARKACHRVGRTAPGTFRRSAGASAPPPGVAPRPRSLHALPHVVSLTTLPMLTPRLLGKRAWTSSWWSTQSRKPCVNPREKLCARSSSCCRVGANDLPSFFFFKESGHPRVLPSSPPPLFSE